MEETWPPLLLTSTDRFDDPTQPDQNCGVWMGRPMPSGFATRRYAKGFRAAANLVTLKALDTPYDPDTRRAEVVYPAVFLYRHAVELLLKALIRDCGELLDLPVKAHGHELDKLWDTARPLAEHVFEHNDMSQNEHVTRLLAEFSTFDPNGEAARYPRSTRDDPHFESLDWLNPRHFADLSERLLEYLEALTEGATAYLEVRDA